ncbi:MAG TPA: hypothetical protein PK208_12005 [Fibrobacteria bacterium]|nr:hypothetical protein [Fibrobacteria bacterium]
MNRPEVFQVDHPLVRQAYRGDNHKIVLDPSRPKEICALYFSSNNIYFPNEESVFRNRIVEADAYEWYRTRVRAAHKHIFLRDIFKQWYLTGLNERVSSPESFLEFLRAQTEGYRIVALGSSAGGYAAVLYGSLLGAERILSFNGQMELDSLLESSVPEINPVLFDLKDTELRKYYDLRGFIRDPSAVYYFHSMHSQWDRDQATHVADLGLNAIGFRTGHHGIPFLKSSLDDVLQLEPARLRELAGSDHWPLLFSARTTGLRKTLPFLAGLAWTQLRKRFARGAGRRGA